MFSKKDRSKGFTLIELMIVVVIICILAALAIPRFMQAGTKAKQSEAKQLLNKLYQLETTYKQLNPDLGFTTDLDLIGFTPLSNGNYTTTITLNGSSGFTATATGNIDDDATEDEWTIDHTGELINTTNDVTQ